MRYLLWAGLALQPALSTACDVCGIFLSIQPHDRTSNVSLLYRYRRLEGTLPGLGVLKHGDHGPAGTGDMHYRELYQVAELRADIWLNDRFAVLAGIPAVNNYRAVNGTVANDVYGVSDPYAIVRYLAVNTRSTDTDQRNGHRLMLGLGAKAPVGKQDLRYMEAEVPHDQQPSTGAWDLLASVEYSMRRGRSGLAATLIGRGNGLGRDDHRMGHGLSTTVEAFRRFDFGENWKLVPSLGAYHELVGKDAEGGSSVSGTGSSTLFTHVGARVWWRSWGFQGAFQYACARQLGDRMIPNRERIVIGLIYNLKKN